MKMKLSYSMEFNEKEKDKLFDTIDFLTDINNYLLSVNSLDNRIEMAIEALKDLATGKPITK
jgi:hypothetical protein